MTSLPDPADYEILFPLQGRSSFLANDFLLRGSLRFGNPLILHRDSNWMLYLRKSHLGVLGRKGYLLLSGRGAFSSYEQEFREYLARARTSIIPKWRENPPKTEEQLREFVKDLGELWWLYGFTEDVYYDNAYIQTQVADGQEKKTLTGNTFTLIKFEEESRSVLGEYVAPDGIICHALSSLERRYGLPEGESLYLTLPELYRLFQGKVPPASKITERKSAYVLCIKNNKEFLLTGRQAERVAASFLTYEQSLRQHNPPGARHTSVALKKDSA